MSLAAPGSFGASFLSCPDLFPARRAGEPAGDRRLALEVTGGPYLVAGLSARQEAALRDRFGERCRGGADGIGAMRSVETRLFAVAPDDFLAVDTRGWEYALDLDHAPESVRVAGLRLMARLDWRLPGDPAAAVSRLAGALWTCEEDGEVFAGLFENYLRVLVAYRLLELGGAVLHSAGVVDSGEALLFLGPSGAGKTTLSRLSVERGRTVLSDDLNAVLPEDGGGPHRVERLPFTGDVGDRAERAGPYPLRAVLRLEKAPAHALRPLSPGRALAALFACAPWVNADPHRREPLLAVLGELAAAVPAGLLAFARDGGFWDMLPGQLP